MRVSKIKQLAAESGLSYAVIQSRGQSHPDATDEQLKLPREQWTRLWKDKSAWYEYTTSEGKTVDIRQLAEQSNVSLKTISSRMYRATAEGRTLSLEMLTSDKRGREITRMFRTPYGILSLKEIAKRTGVSYDNLLYRARKHPDISYQELVCAPAVYHYKKPRVEAQYVGYTWNEIRRWYLDRGRHCENWEEILEGMLAGNTDDDIETIKERLRSL